MFFSFYKYPPKVKEEDLEKLGAKAVKEEFHGISHGNGKYTYQQLYHWDSLTANVWLPGLSELVGHDPNKYNATNGCYNSAMQGLNMSGKWYWVDPNGGTQFVYFKQFNTFGGGQKLWDACNQQQAWTRSTSYSTTTHAWRIASVSEFYHTPATTSHAVLVGTNSISFGLVFVLKIKKDRKESEVNENQSSFIPLSLRRYKLYITHYPLKGKGGEKVSLFPFLSIRNEQKTEEK